MLPISDITKLLHSVCPARMKFDSVFRDISQQGRKFGIGLGVVSQQVSQIYLRVLTQLITQLTVAMDNSDER